MIFVKFRSGFGCSFEGYCSEMYAIQQLNKESNQLIFGIVSNGEFTQLSQNTSES
jgi:hypothetical protein